MARVPFRILLLLFVRGHAAPLACENIALVVQVDVLRLFFQTRCAGVLSLDRLPPSRAFCLPPAPHPLLSPPLAPIAPTRLHPLQNSEFVHRSDWTLGTAGPRMRT